MPGVPDDRVAGGLEHPVQRQGQLDHAEIRPEVPASAGHVLDQEGTDLGRQLVELVAAQTLQVLGTADVFEHARPPR